MYALNEHIEMHERAYEIHGGAWFMYTLPCDIRILAMFPVNAPTRESYVLFYC